MSLFKLSKRADYALALLALLAQKPRGRKMSLSGMEKLGMPRAFMAQIGKDLVERGVLESKEGKGGGYFLADEPGNITVLKVLEAVEGKTATVDCDSCGVSVECGQKGFMENLENDLKELLAGYTLIDLIE